MGIHRAASSEYQQQQFLKTKKERINRIETRNTKLLLHFFKHVSANWRVPKSTD